MARNLGHEFMTTGKIAPLFVEETKMSSTKFQKLAATDAERWAAAEMFYGEGAGTRRKLLDAELQTKYDIPGYYEAFIDAYRKLDLNKFAEQAVKERKRIDRAASAGKNIRAIKNGNIRGLSNGVLVVVGVAYVAHATGYDKVLEAEMKKTWARAKENYETLRDSRRARKAREQAYNVTDIKR